MIDLGELLRGAATRFGAFADSSTSAVVLAVNEMVRLSEGYAVAATEPVYEAILLQAEKARGTLADLATSLGTRGDIGAIATGIDDALGGYLVSVAALRDQTVEQDLIREETLDVLGIH